MMKMKKIKDIFSLGSNSEPLEISDKSLLKCILKKSVHTTKKLGVFGLKAGIIVGGVALLIWGGITIIPHVLNFLLPVVSGIFSALSSLLALVPVWVYGLIAIPAVILGYSFLWCVKRDLREEDWKSKAANDFAFALTLTVFILALVVFLAPTPIPTPIIAFASIAVAIILVFFFFFLLIFALEPVEVVTPIYYIFRFPGAWWHHRRTPHKAEKGEVN
jgi:hypothetical protein